MVGGNSKGLGRSWVGGELGENYKILGNRGMLMNIWYV